MLNNMYVASPNFSVHPIVLSPKSLEVVRPLYNASHSISCEVTGKPQVEVSWMKNALPISSGDFLPQNDTVIPLTDGPYGVTEAIKSQLSWIPQNTEATCETVTKYDGNYQCVDTMEELSETRSPDIRIINQCKFNKFVLCICIHWP